MFIQLRFSNPVPFIKRQRSLPEAVLISFGSINKFPKTLWRWWASTLQQQIVWCTVSVSFLQNLQVGSPCLWYAMPTCIVTLHYLYGHHWVVLLIAKIYSIDDRGVCKCGALVDHTDMGKHKYSENTCPSAIFCPPQILCGLAWASAVISQRLIEQ
jgi:hypothetical protein